MRMPPFDQLADLLIRLSHDPAQRQATQHLLQGLRSELTSQSSQEAVAELSAIVLSIFSGPPSVREALVT